MPLPPFGARFGAASLGREQARRATRVPSGELSERALGVAMLAPMALVLLLVVAYPLADSLWLSLHRVNLANPEQGQPFVGLGNYLHAFRQAAFWHAIHRTLYFTLLSVALQLALGLVFAVLLNERQDFFGQNGAANARSDGNTVTGTPDCHCTITTPAPTRRPFSSNLSWPPG